jgi:ribose transport system permease protein
MLLRLRVRGTYVRKEVVVGVALLVMGAVTAYSNPAFASLNNLSNVALQIALLGVIALGAGLVIVTGGIDLSIGSMVGLTAVIVGKLAAGPEFTGMGKPLWLAIIVGVGVATLLGAFQGVLIARLGLQPFIVTLGGMLCFRGIAQTITQGGNITINDKEHPTFRHLREWGPSFSVQKGTDGFGDPLLDTFILGAPVLIFIGLALLAAYLLHFTVYGRRLFAVGGNREAARYAGVPVKATETSVYAVSGFLAGVAGVLYASYLGDITHGLGATYELYAIAAAVLGGVSLRGGEGTVIGVVLGAALFRLLENGINMLQPVVDRTFASAQWKLDNSREIVIGAVILGAVLFDQATQAWRNYRQTRRPKAKVE